MGFGNISKLTNATQSALYSGKPDIHRLQHKSNETNMTKESILIVEDDEEIAMLLEFLLSREGYRVSLAKDGHAAQHFIEHSPPFDLVLLDVMLPYVNGTHLLEQIRATPLWADSQIVMLTSKSGEREVAGALNLGADDFISKPFKPVELIARINHRLKRKKTS